MIQEDYVSFETAKLLKEKGIEDDCEYTGWIGESGNHYFPDDTYYDDDEIIAVRKDRKEFIPLISFQMAMKWLREVHNCHICVQALITTDGLQGYCPFYTTVGGAFMWQNALGDDYATAPTYEEACEAAIKYCLENLI